MPRQSRYTVVVVCYANAAVADARAHTRVCADLYGSHTSYLDGGALPVSAAACPVLPLQLCNGLQCDNTPVPVCGLQRYLFGARSWLQYSRAAEVLCRRRCVPVRGCLVQQGQPPHTQRPFLCLGTGCLFTMPQRGFVLLLRGATVSLLFVLPLQQARAME